MLDIASTADITSEKFIIDEIKKRYPDHGILSEEAGGKVTDWQGNKIKNRDVSHSYKAGTYGFPGGRLELTESLIDCGKRELQNDYNFIHFGFVCSDYSGSPEVKEIDKCEA